MNVIHIGQKFFIKMRPIHHMSPFFSITYTTSTDEEKWVECMVVESPFKYDSYKITLRALEPGYGHEVFYRSDFISMVASGHILEKIDNTQHVEQVILGIDYLAPNFYVEHRGYIVVSDLLLKIAQKVRKTMVKKYGDDLSGHCVEASELIHDMLKDKGIESRVIEGYCVYDDDSSCSDRGYDEHTWVECGGYYIDVTADQFNYYMDDTLLSDIYVTLDKPKCMVYEEPENDEEYAND